MGAAIRAPMSKGALPQAVCFPMISLAQQSEPAINRRAVERAYVIHIREHLHCALDLACKVEYGHVHYLVEIALLALAESAKVRGIRARHGTPPAA